MAEQNTLRMGLDVKFNTHGQCCGVSLFALEEVVVQVQILAGPPAGFFLFFFFFLSSYMFPFILAVYLREIFAKTCFQLRIFYVLNRVRVSNPQSVAPQTQILVIYPPSGPVSSERVGKSAVCVYRTPLFVFQSCRFHTTRYALIRIPKQSPRVLFPLLYNLLLYLVARNLIANVTHWRKRRKLPMSSPPIQRSQRR